MPTMTKDTSWKIDSSTNEITLNTAGTYIDRDIVINAPYVLNPTEDMEITDNLSGNFSYGYEYNYNEEGTLVLDSQWEVGKGNGWGYDDEYSYPELPVQFDSSCAIIVSPRKNGVVKMIQNFTKRQQHTDMGNLTVDRVQLKRGYQFNLGIPFDAPDADGNYDYTIFRIINDADGNVWVE